MLKLLKYLDTVTDNRQEKKVQHKMSDIIALVFFAMLANADEGEKVKKLLAIDGKTQCGNGNKNQKANHIVSAVNEDGFCIGEKLVNEKSNEITAIPKLLDDLNVKGRIITIDAMGTQTEIAKKIRQKRADYVLALKGNQGNLHEDVKLYFSDSELLSKCAYKTTTETRYFISSLAVDIDETIRTVRGHWMIESYHWHLDVTFHEDENRTIEKQAAFNLNIIRK